MTFEPTPELARMQKRAHRLRRNMNQASMFRHRLVRRAAAATFAAAVREDAERQKWEADRG